jgi:hypothetical protein
MIVKTINDACITLNKKAQGLEKKEKLNNLKL